MLQQRMGPEKPEITIGVLGQDGVGKTSLSNALLHCLYGLNLSVNVGGRENFMEDKPDAFQYETDARRYQIVDLQGHIGVMKALILNSLPLHSAILVVSATEGICTEAREQVMLAQAVGIAAIVVFVTKSDLVHDSELLEVVELEVRELLTNHGYADDTPILYGSAIVPSSNLKDIPIDL